MPLVRFLSRTKFSSTRLRKLPGTLSQSTCLSSTHTDDRVLTFIVSGTLATSFLPFSCISFGPIRRFRHLLFLGIISLVLMACLDVLRSCATPSIDNPFFLPFLSTLFRLSVVPHPIKYHHHLDCPRLLWWRCYFGYAPSLGLGAQGGADSLDLS